MHQKSLGAARSAYVPEVGPHPPYRIDAASADARLLTATMQQAESWPRYEEIAHRHDSELDEVIAKPWGHEYRIYCDPFFDVWRLTLEPGHGTSEHCHPRKSTALICLSGEGRLTLLTGTYLLGPNDVVVIGKGVFHSTKNIGSQPLEVIEVELPRNKFDLVRAEDSYGRRASPYTDPTIDEIAVPPMVDTPLVENAKYRPFCAAGRSRFDVVRGDSLPRRARPQDGAFYGALSLATSCALTDTITLLTSSTEWPDTVDPHGIYFTILSTAPRQGIRPRAGGSPAYKTWFAEAPDRQPANG
jgi:mannose-6-phosphate isomerase-like protein (cupin superfamily)